MSLNKAGFRRSPEAIGHSGLAGFTLVELLIVIAIIGILIALMFPVFHRIQSRGRQAACQNNLHQFALGIVQYRNEHDGAMPPWLSALYPEYVSAKSTFICLSDGSRGVDGSKPDADDAALIIGAPYEETDDCLRNTAATNRSAEIPLCSYMYEFSDAVCSWGWTAYLGSGVVDGQKIDRNGNPSVTTWNEVKEWQLTRGDSHHPGAYNEIEFPMVRCFHHWDEKDIEARRWDDDANGGRGDYVGSKRDRLTLNAAYAGNVFPAPIKWEEKIK